jgi:hypothetical protein
MPADARRGVWSVLLVMNVVLCTAALLVLAVRSSTVIGPSSWVTLTVVNASSERVLVTPVADRARPMSPSGWSGHWPGRGERGMLLIEQGGTRPGTRVGRFEVAPGATWSARVEREGRTLAGVVVQGVDGTARRLRTPDAPAQPEVSLRIDDVAKLPEVTAQEAAWYAAIPAELGVDVLGYVLWLPLVNLPWVWWMWRRSSRVGVVRA